MIKGVMRGAAFGAALLGVGAPALSVAQDSQLEQKSEEVFRGLQRLIQTTPDNDPKKPELYFRLSELYWKRASNAEVKAGDDNVACLQAAGDNDAALDACKEKFDARLAEIDQTDGEQARKIYQFIVRTYPDYENIDRVLYALGFDYQQKGDRESARKFYIYLIQNHPDSPNVPDALYNMGELYFADNDVDSALKFYEKVTTDYRESPMYNFALHKVGWCQFNKQQYLEALDTFVAVINHANSLGTQASKTRLTRKKEALNDTVMVYVNLQDTPKHIIEFYKKLAPDDYLNFATTLAGKYADTGQVKSSNALYRELIKHYPNTYKAVGFQIRIVQNATLESDAAPAVQDIQKLANLWRSGKELPDAEPGQVAADQAVIEAMLRKLAEERYAQAERIAEKLGEANGPKVRSKKDYESALDLYTSYLETFPDSPNLYVALFNTANLNFNLQRYEPSAKYYEQMLVVNPNGEATEAAAYNMVACYQNLLVAEENAALEAQKAADKKAGRKGPKKEQKADAMLSEGEEATIPQPKELSHNQARYLAAIELYSKYVKEGDELIDLQYAAAKLYYDTNHFDKAIPIFKNISEQHSNNENAIFAANLLLDTYNLTMDYDSFNAEVETFLTIYTAQRDAKFNSELQAFKRQASFKRCSAFETKKDYLGAGRCFYRYAKSYPDSDLVDKAYYNAALNYEREKNVERAVEIRVELVNTVQNSELVPKALYQIAGNQQALATYSTSATAYEVYAANYPDRPEAEEALQIAATFRQGLGELKKAIDDSYAYIDLVGADKTKAAEAHYNIGHVLELQEKWYQVNEHYADFFRKYRKHARMDLILAAHLHSANAYIKRGGGKNEKAAKEEFAEVYNIFTTLNDEQKKGLDLTGRTAIAEARFKMAEDAYRRFEANPMVLPKQRDVQKYIDEMTNRIVDRNKAAHEVEEIYREVISYDITNWGMAAAVRIGQMQQQLAQDIYNIEAPPSFDPDTAEGFKNTMVQLAEQPTTLAIGAYEYCLNQARERKWVNQWSEIASKELAELKPEAYSHSYEIRSGADHFSPDYMTKNFILALRVDESQIQPEAEAGEAEGQQK